VQIASECFDSSDPAQRAPIFGLLYRVEKLASPRYTIVTLSHGARRNQTNRDDNGTQSGQPARVRAKVSESLTLDCVLRLRAAN
jgi:hypothetical protein